MKASTQISAWTDFTRTYNGYNYKFYVLGGESGLPNDYSFNSDVIDYVIETCGKAQRYQIENRSEIVPVAWAQEQTQNLLNWVFGAVVNAYTATGSILHDYINSAASTYSWDFSFTGSDDTYPGWDTYGTAFGFTFKGACADTIDLVLDSQGNFYGHNPIGNYTIDSDPEPYNWILINQGLDNFYTPSYNVGSFNDYPKPYFEGKDLHFFSVIGGDLSNIKESVVHNCDNTYILAHSYNVPSGRVPQITFYHVKGNLSSNPLSITSEVFGDPYFSSASCYFNSNGIDPSNVGSNNSKAYYTMRLNTASSYMFNQGLYLPCGDDTNTPILLNTPVYNGFQFLNTWAPTWISGNEYIFLKSFDYTPNTNPNPIPEDPIPITSIPEDPEDPIPQRNPDPVPGITYPEPSPPPLPPFASIVSGNDDLWGLTLDLNGAENSLLPYLNSLATFEFPSFDSLISDFSGSIIWVAQLMSVLYNGTSFNILFVVLCLFSLVTIIIGGYKLWNTTEPDPNNPGFRRTKKPPKVHKGRRK